jgi:HTH-type transcriptional regulator/antitoxin HigA
MTDTPLPYEPDHVIPPGHSLRSTLTTLGMTQADLAARAGLSLKHVNQIVQGLAPLTHETALSFEKVTGVPARIWNALEARYRDCLAREADAQVLAADSAWLKGLPIKELRRRGYVSKSSNPGVLVQEVCRFFGVANRDSWERVWREPLASFRKSQTLASDSSAVATWLRIGELNAKTIESKLFDQGRFRAALQEIRSLTIEDPDKFVPTMTKLCSRAGVVVVFVPEIQGTRCWGATRWLTPARPLIQLSLRSKTDDHLWFSFFHEAGHVLLHSKKGTFVRTDSSSDIAEEEANSFSSSLLIPKRFEGRLRNLSLNEITSFAEELGIAPGIVVGRLQKEEILPWNQANHLKKRFEFVDEP